MSTGLIALLDDVAAIAKMAAASLDDVAAQSAKAGAKAAGVVIDDAAVTPRYVQGFSPARELPIVWRIARGSLKNKLVFLLPAALLLSALAPFLITPLLMLGGAYLCYEGAEKVWEAIAPHEAKAHEAITGQAAPDAALFEDSKVRGAIQTDFILSAEIMAITLGSMPELGFMMQAVVLAVVGIGITVAVYGAVALIVKADDVGVLLACGDNAALQAFGRGLVRFMPVLLRALAVVGTAAMVWVGGGIILHGLEAYGLGGPAHALHGVAVAAGGGILGWAVEAAGAGVAGLVLGAALIPLVHYLGAPLMRRLRRG
jgi:predicted DNA repair protein MutK